MLFILIEKLTEFTKFLSKLRGNVCFFLGWQAKIRLGPESPNWSIRRVSQILQGQCRWESGSGSIAFLWVVTLRGRKVFLSASTTAAGGASHTWSSGAAKGSAGWGGRTCAVGSTAFLNLINKKPNSSWSRARILHLPSSDNSDSSKNLKISYWNFVKEFKAG